MTAVVGSVRIELAGFLSSLILVYSALIIAWVVTTWLAVAGARPGLLAPVFDFLDAVVGPLMRLLRRFIPPIGPVDISPIVALLALQILGGVIVSVIRG